ncbi:MAG: Hsp70 family protein [Deltaproteobacteria bacterium]|nr:Hsp70 family protein [Deltaproteobacteria bacterium]
MAKEAIGPSTRKITLDLEVLGPRAPEAPLVVPVAEYFARVTPLVERTIDALARVLGAESRATLDLENAATEAGLAGLYVVGGASALPIVARELRERFGRRVHRSPHPAGAIAIGLAIAADVAQAEVVGERLTRHLGVFREARAGERKVFDPIFASGTPMPEPGAPPLVVTRTYRAAHNVGQLRFVECADLDADAEPQGDITPHATIVFPYTPAARGMTVEAASVERLDGPGRWIAERYEVDPAGVIAVTISDLEDGFARMYTL